MKKKFIAISTFVLTLSILLSSCANKPTGDSATTDESSKAPVQTEEMDSSASGTESEPSRETTDKESSGANTETNNNENTESESDNESTEQDNISDSQQEANTSALEHEFGYLIENAADLKNGVQAYFTDANRDYFALENAQMKFAYSLRSDSAQLVSSLVNSSGMPYITDTMDVFVRTNNGNTYLASGSTTNATANLYRIGMYYYEARFEEQNFLNSPTVTDGAPLTDITFNSASSNNIASKTDTLYYIKNHSDPYMVFNNVSFSADDYNLLKIRLRSVSGTKGTGSVYLIAGSATSFAKEQSATFTFSTNGEYHDIYVPLYRMQGYSGNVSGLRIDIDGNSGDSFEIAEISPANLSIDSSTPIALSLCRSFYVYTDKMHHDIQIAATDVTKGIAEVGMLTKINVDTVDKIYIKDKNGPHTSLDNIDWTSVEYVGFDIKEVGIFGYILPVHENAGKITVALVDGVYVIEQTRSPEKTLILPSEEGTENANDFHLSQRIYTDENHSFDEFIKEAEIERNPIDKYFRVNETPYATSSFTGYDPIRGIYVINMDGPGGFNSPYYLYQNRYFTTDITVRSPDERNIYVMTVLESGALECSVLLDSNNILMPIPVSVCKNFSETAGERNLYNIDDPDYSEAFFPMALKPNDRYELTVANIYQNWGQYPLKQISSIQFRAPYYHLSTGVTESNCILPWYNTKTDNSLNTLPDFRAMSAPLWEGQPQRNSGGSHSWLEYTDADGNYSATENYGDYIDSYGPTYADVTMYNISDDGRIKATYTHTEMPQTDENRTYYEIKYEILKDIHIKDFRHDFTFYAVTDNEPAATADYRQIGYLNTDNQCVVTKSNLTPDTVQEYVLGDNCPYFSMFNMPADASPDGYTNVACLIYNSQIIIDGKENNSNFIIINSYNKINLSLDIGEITLKAGDSFTINAILMPWGSHESDYSDGDVNVRQVRENTLLNPLTITSTTDSVIESTYIPKIMSADGETATFTLKDGYNNIAVRAYGFKKLTVPTLYELIDGNWEKIELSSSAAPDKSGYYHYYDGYMIHYDGDGTYSYSFVTAMENGMERTFKLDLSNYVESLPDSGKNESPDYLDIYYDPAEMQNLIQGSPNYLSKFSQIVLAEDQSYISLYANQVDESFFMIKPDADKISGQYIVVKYRIPTTNATRLNNFEFYLSTSSEQPISGENIKYPGIKRDGEWHVAVIDASTFNHPTFSTNEDGKYAIKYIRFDMLNTPGLTPDHYVDLAYFGLCDTLEEVCDLAREEFSEIDFVTGSGEYPLDTETYTPIIKTYIDPESNYKESDLAYYSVVDTFNGVKLNATGNSAEGIMVITDFNSEVPASVSVGGWALAEGGIDCMVWSCDGGKTWNKINATLNTAPDSYITHAQTKLTAAMGKSFKFNDNLSTKNNSAFQAPKMTIDLSMYAGQTVNFTLAAIPASNTETLCLFMHIENLKISN